MAHVKSGYDGRRMSRKPSRTLLAFLLSTLPLAGCMGTGGTGIGSSSSALVSSSTSQRVVTQIINNSCGEAETASEEESSGSVKGLSKVIDGFGIPYDERADNYTTHPTAVTDDSYEANKERGIGYTGIEDHYVAALASGEEHSPDHPEHEDVGAAMFTGLTTKEEQYGCAMRWEYYNPDLSGPAVDGYFNFLKGNGSGHMQYLAVHATVSDKWVIVCPYDWGPALNLPTTGGGKYAGGRIGGLSPAAAEALGISGGDGPENAMTEWWWVENSSQVECGPIDDLSSLTKGTTSGSTSSASSSKPATTARIVTKAASGIASATSASASSDTPVSVAPANPESFVDMCMPEWQHGSLPKGSVRYIVTHNANAGVGDPANIALSLGGSHAASHFVIGKDGTIVRCVPIDKIAHHAGASGDAGANERYGIRQERDDLVGENQDDVLAMDAWSIGITLAHDATDDGYPNAQLNALDRLIAYIDQAVGSQPRIIGGSEWTSADVAADASQEAQTATDGQATGEQQEPVDDLGQVDALPAAEYRESRNHSGVNTAADAAKAAARGDCSDPGDEEAEELSTNLADVAVSLAGTASPTAAIAGSAEGEPTDPRLKNYVEAHKKYITDYGPDNIYASCDRAACTAIRASGVDAEFPYGPCDSLLSYCQSSSKWKEKGKWRLSDSADSLSPGDVLVCEGHIKIFVGNEAVRKKFPSSDANMFSASYNDYQPWCYDESRSYDQKVYSIFSCSSPDGGAAGATGDRAKIIEFAKSQLGVPYNYNGSWDLDVPNQQMACNGLTRWAYNSVGITIPAGSIDQIEQMPNISSTGKVSDLIPGDIVCFDNVGRRSDISYPIISYRHVAIYAGNGEIIEETPPRCVSRNISDGDFSFGGSFGNLGSGTSSASSASKEKGKAKSSGGAGGSKKSMIGNTASGEVLGRQLAWLAVQMAATGAAGDGMMNHVRLPDGVNHQYRVSDNRLENAYAIHTATLQSHGGNMAIASCTQAACAAAAAVVDMDMCPNTGGASGGPDGMQDYLDSHDFFKEVQVSSIDELKPGDILNCPAHTALFVGTELAQTKFPGTNCNVYEAGYHSRAYCGLSVYKDVTGYHVFRPVKRNMNSQFDDVDWVNLVTNWSCDPPTGLGSSLGGTEGAPINVQITRS